MRRDCHSLVHSSINTNDIQIRIQNQIEIKINVQSNLLGFNEGFEFKELDRPTSEDGICVEVCEAEEEVANAILMGLELNELGWEKDCEGCEEAICVDWVVAWLEVAWEVLRFFSSSSDNALNHQKCKSWLK